MKKRRIMFLCGCFCLNVACTNSEVDTYVDKLEKLHNAISSGAIQATVAFEESDYEAGCKIADHMILHGYEALNLLNNPPAIAGSNTISVLSEIKLSITDMIVAGRELKVQCKSIGL